MTSALEYSSRKTYLAILGIRNVGILRVKLLSTSFADCSGLEIRRPSDFFVTDEIIFSSFLRLLLSKLLLFLFVVGIDTAVNVAGAAIVLLFETNV
jgi:hypothetical protein